MRILNITKNIEYQFGRINRCIFNKKPIGSVYFYTFHKCASTLFSRYILKNITGLEHINYASQLNNGRRNSKEKINFKENGYIYGPIRISAGETSHLKELVEPTTKHNFIRNKIAIFLIRDPRDILVSSYYSFGFSHGFSRDAIIRERQKVNREKIKNMTLDEYVLESVTKQVKYFKTLYNLSQACERSIVLRYEDMINDFDIFAEQLQRYITIDDTTIQEIYRRSRPKGIEDKTSHRRSGQVEGFREKLEDDTIEKLNITLKNTLELFGYKM